MAKYYFIAEAKYADGRKLEGKAHKEAKRCYEDLKRFMNKLSAEGLIYLGISRQEKDGEKV